MREEKQSRIEREAVVGAECRARLVQRHEDEGVGDTTERQLSKSSHKGTEELSNFVTE